MSRFGLGVVDELEASIGTPSQGDAHILVQQIVSISVKISYLLWRFGRRVTDKHGQAEAEHLLQRLGLVDTSPIAPASLSRLIDLLPATDEELRQAIDPDLLTVTVQGVTYPLRPILAALRELHADLSADLASPTPAAD